MRPAAPRLARRRPARRSRSPLGALGACTAGGTSTDADWAACCVARRRPRRDRPAGLGGTTPPGDGTERSRRPRGRRGWPAGRADVLVVSLVDGSLRTSDPIDPGDDPTWRKVSATGADGEQADGSLLLPVVGPGGRPGRRARRRPRRGPAPDAHRPVGPTPRSRSTSDEPVVGRAAGVGRSDDLVAIVTGRRRDAPASILVDTTTGRDRRRARPAAGSSRRRRTAARWPWWSPARDTDRDPDDDGWLGSMAGRRSAIDRCAPGAVSVASMALDADGHAAGGRLARATAARSGSPCHDRIGRLAARGVAADGQARRERWSPGSADPFRQRAARVRRSGPAPASPRRSRPGRPRAASRPKTFWRVRRWTHDPQLSK